MKAMCLISRCFFVATIIFVSNIYSMQQQRMVQSNLKLSISSLNEMPYGRVIATHATGEYLKKREINRWGIIAGQAGASAAARTGSSVLAQSDKPENINYSREAKQAVLHFGADGILRVIEDYMAYYGISSKAVVQKSKEYLPETLADGVEVVAPVVGEILHATVSESLTNAVAEKTGCNK